jgi:hypothetical protein
MLDYFEDLRVNGNVQVLPAG